MPLGYGWFSTVAQNLDSPREAVVAAGREEILVDKASGSRVTGWSGLFSGRLSAQGRGPTGLHRGSPDFEVKSLDAASS